MKILDCIKNKITNLLNTKQFEIFILCLISLNLFVFIFQTDINIATQFKNVFYFIEIFSVIIFSIEYLLRLFTIKEFKNLFNFYMIIDLCAILPYYLTFITANTVILRTLRLFRLVRIFKVARYATAFDNIKKAFQKRTNELVITATIFIIAVLVASTLIYFAEHNGDQEAFKSIPSAFWWAIVTFTTVGYGDSYPVTAIGKCIASLCAIFGVGLHGLLIGIISSALMEVINGNKN